VIVMASTTHGADTPADQVVAELRLRASAMWTFADLIADRDQLQASKVREDACQLRCQAAVIEAIAALFDELGLMANQWGAVAEHMRRYAYPPK
jgi:hypothetical protein